MKLLASDYDGTLHYGGSIMEDDLKAIARWKEDGNLFVIATGRSWPSIRKQMEKFDLSADYIITNNGGMVFDRNGSELMSNFLDYVTALDILYAAKESENVASYVVNDGQERHKVVVDPTVTDHRYPTMQPDVPEEEVMDMGRFAQIVLSMGSAEAARLMTEQINHFFGAYVNAYTNNTVVDVVPKGVSKQSGLDFVRAFIDVEDEDVYAIGDSYNDVPMLESVDNSFVLATAPEDVQNQARHVVVSISNLIEVASR